MDRPPLRTAFELIELLKHYPPNTFVVVDGYEGGLSNITLREVRFVPQEPDNLFGDHHNLEEYDDGYVQALRGICISRFRA